MKPRKKQRTGLKVDIEESKERIEKQNKKKENGERKPSPAVSQESSPADEEIDEFLDVDNDEQGTHNSSKVDVLIDDAVMEVDNESEDNEEDDFADVKSKSESNPDPMLIQNGKDKAKIRQ